MFFLFDKNVILIIANLLLILLWFTYNVISVYISVVVLVVAFFVVFVDVGAFHGLGLSVLPVGGLKLGKVGLDQGAALLAVVLSVIVAFVKGVDVGGCVDLFVVGFFVGLVFRVWVGFDRVIFVAGDVVTLSVVFLVFGVFVRLV